MARHSTVPTRRTTPPHTAIVAGDGRRHRALGHVIEARRLLEAGDAAAAERACRRALRLAPDEPNALNFLGVALGRLGRTDEAERCARRAVALDPDDAGRRTNLANRLKEAGEVEAALAGYRRALALDPDHAPALRNLARTLAELGRAAEAEAPARRLTALEPDDASAWALLAELLAWRHRHDEAIDACRRALALDPNRPDRWLNLARMGLLASRWEEVVEPAAERALAFDPDHAEARVLLANALYRRNLLGRTRELLEAVPPVGLHGANALNLLGVVLVRQARVEEGLAVLERVPGLAPDAIELHMNCLLHANYDPEPSPETLRRQHEAWGERFAPPAPAVARFAGRADPERPLRIGYLSPDFRRHSVAHFMAPLLHAHDRSAFEAYCYASVAREDAVTDELRSRADGWRDVRPMGDAQVAELIRADGIDILVELAGHTQDSRLPVCALRPAPVQIAYIGYPNTTGMAAMDYRLTDHRADPEGFDAHYTETLVRLPRCFLCYGLPADAPEEVGPPPVRRNGRITFGSFNNLAKVNRGVIALWARVLARVPGSRLLIKASGTGDPETRDNLYARLREAGVPAERIEIVPYTATPAEHLAVYHEVDIALDTFPYNGTTTTCEALWMGVPVITLAGDRHAARVGASLLTAVGFAAGIAHTPEDYELTAALLAGQPDLLAAARRALRADMARSPLCQARDHAAAVEEAYRAVWRIWCDDAG